MGGHLLQRTGRNGPGGAGSPAQGVFGVSCQANGVCCVVLRCVVLRGVVVCGPLHGRACHVGVRCVVLFGLVCCGGVWPPSWWGVVWWCVAPLMVGLCYVVLCLGALRCVVLCCGALCGLVVVRRPPHGGAYCVGVWPPVRWGVLCWGAVCCVVWGGVWPLMVGLAAMVCGSPHGGAWCVVLYRVALRCVVLCRLV